MVLVRAHPELTELSYGMAVSALLRANHVRAPFMGRRVAMRMKIVSGFAAAAFGAALTVGFGTPAQAQAAHDGRYAVHIVTHRGSCPKTYTAEIAVSGSQIHATGHSHIRGSGHIDASDKVLGTLRLLHHAVHVTGRMHGHSGSGKWSSQGLDCSGTWRAARLS